jgi:hypothetical protein
MDALLAEKVMGYTLSDLSLLAYPKYKLFDIESGEFSGYVKEVPHYSTDIAAAWQVVRKIQQDFFINLICGRNEGRKNGRIGYNCDIGYYENNGAPEWYSDSQTAPLAICRAALKAMGVTEI